MKDYLTYIKENVDIGNPKDWTYIKFRTPDEFRYFMEYLEELGFLWMSRTKPTRLNLSKDFKSPIRIRLHDKRIRGTGDVKLEYFDLLNIDNFIENDDETIKIIEDRKRKELERREEIRLRTIDIDPYGEEDWE